MPESIPLAAFLEDTLVASARAVPAIGDIRVAVSDFLQLTTSLIFIIEASRADEGFFIDLFQGLKFIAQGFRQGAVIHQLLYSRPCCRLLNISPGHLVSHNSSSLKLVHYYYNMYLHNFQSLLFSELFC